MLHSLKNDSIWKRALQRSLPFIFCVLLAFSCGQKISFLSDRAEKQLPVSFTQEIQDYDPNAHDWTFKDVETLYENDSICVKQFIVCYYDGGNIYRERDYRYIYLVDMLESRFRHQLIFNETFINTFWMPKDAAEELRRKIRREDINVYDECYALTLPVRQ